MKRLGLTILGVVIIASGILYWRNRKETKTILNDNPGRIKSAETQEQPVLPPLDKTAYDAKLLAIANLPTTTASTTTNLWPVKTVYPNARALLPFNRIVAYYGNLYSQYMGVLGQYPEDEMLSRLQTEVAKWQQADPVTPVIPALHYIAVVGKPSAGPDGKYRTRMPDSQIDAVLAMAQKINALVFLDLQIGQSDVQTEVPRLEKYLKLPNVHLGIDPEFSMKQGGAPGTRIGTLDASDINFAAQYLAQIVKENHLTPKILIIHRFTQGMVTNYQDIKALPEVQIVMNMDGFGGPAKKKNTYKQFIFKEPVQFTGFKLFYKNDTDRGGLMTPEEVLKLSPQPVYIQYQ